jgi:hypothetical protein
VSFDADLVRELELGDEALSKQVNDAVRTALAARRRGRLLALTPDTDYTIVGEKHALILRNEGRRPRWAMAHPT